MFKVNRSNIEIAINLSADCYISPTVDKEFHHGTAGILQNSCSRSHGKTQGHRVKGVT